MKEKTELQTVLTKKGSAFKKYKALVIGRGGIFSLFKYEIITLLFGGLPGAPGIFARKIFYRVLFKKIGRGVVLGKGLTLRHPGKISMGNNVVIDDYCVLDAKGEKDDGISIGDNAFISRNTILSCKGGKIEIGENTNIGAYCSIYSESSVKLGKNILIAGFTYIVAGGSHDFSRKDIPIMAQPSLSLGGVEIHDNVWLGARVTVLDGVTIGRDTLVGAAGLVNKDLPEFVVAAGIPARVIKQR